MQPPPLSSATDATVELLPLLTSGMGEAIVAVVKQRFRVSPGGKVERTPGAKVNVADVPWDEDAPGKSSVKLASDLCLVKPATDVLVTGSAIAPGGTRVKQLDVALRVGAIQKVVRVYGPRVWVRGVVGLALSAPEPFESVELRWENAWGGRDDTDPRKPLEEPRNPAGRGLTRDPAKLLHQLGPSIEDPAHPLDGRSPAPAGLGPIGRHFMPRRRYAGTYDEVPYGFRVYAGEHPIHIAAAAVLRGIVPPRVATSRVLELGCAEGGQIIHLAEEYPEATFLGIELSPSQVERASEHIAAVGVHNVEVRQGEVRVGERARHHRQHDLQVTP